MSADELILKKRGERFKIKIKDLGRKHAPPNCSVSVNMKNYKDLSLFLEDLKVLWGCPVDKAIEEFKRNQNDKKGPFW